MADLTERLKLLLSLDGADKVVEGFQKTGKSADKDLGNAEGKLDKLGSTLTKTGAGAVAFAGVAGAGLVKAATAFTGLALEAGKMADATGLSVEEASRWIEVAGDVGVSTETVQGSFQKFNKAVADGKPSLQEYGVEIAKTKDGVVDANGTFINAIDVIGRIEDPTKRAQAAQELFGRSYGEIAELIETGADGVKTALAEVSEGKVINEDELAKAKEFRASMDALKDAGEDLMLAIGQGVTPVLAGFADVASKAVGFVGELNEKTDGASGTILAIGTAGLGAAGGLSVAVGQIIKMRDNLSKIPAAVTAATAVVAIGAIAYTTYASEKAKAEQRTREFTDALKLEGAAQKDALDSLIVAKFSQEKYTDALAATGLTVSDVSKAVQGEASPAFDQLNALYEKSGWNVIALNARLKEAGYPEIAEDVMLLGSAVDVMSSSYEEGAAQAAREKAAQDDLTKSTGDLGSGMNELHASVDGATGATNSMSDAVAGATDKTDGYISSADKAKAITDEWTQKWDALTGRFNTEEAWLNLSKQFDELKTKGAEAMTAVSEGSMTAEDAVRDQRLGTLDLIESTAQYLQEVLKIPAERATEIVALIDQGKLDEAEQAIALATLPREVPVRLKVTNAGEVSVILGAGRSASASGGPMLEGQTTRINDGGRPEMWVNDRGEQFMLAPSNGHVVANPGVRPLGGGGGGGLTINSVTINLPPGADGDSVIAAIKKFESRNGPGWRAA